MDHDGRLGVRPHSRPRSNDPLYPDSHRNHDPPPASPRGQIDFEQFVTLGQVRGTVMQYALLFQGRAKLLELYSGTPHEEWFLKEIIAEIDRITPYSGGVSFLFKIHNKIESVPREWMTEIISRTRDILKFDSSIPLIMSIFERGKDDTAIVEQAKNIVMWFETVNDPNYMLLFRRILKLYRANDRIMHTLCTFRWESRRELHEYFTILIQYAPWGLLRQSVVNLVNNPLAYTNDRCYMCMYASVLKYVDEERDRMLNYLISNIQYYMNGADSVVILKEIINVATMQQRSMLLNKFESAMMEMHVRDMVAPGWMGDVFDHLLVSVPSNTRLVFLEKNQKYIKSYNSRSLSVILKYMSSIMPGT